MDDEKDKRRISRLHTSSRHSLFSGTFTRLTMVDRKESIDGTQFWSNYFLLSPFLLAGWW